MFYSCLRKENGVLKRNVLNKKDAQSLYNSFLLMFIDKTVFSVRKRQQHVMDP